MEERDDSFDLTRSEGTSKRRRRLRPVPDSAASGVGPDRSLADASNLSAATGVAVGIMRTAERGPLRETVSRIQIPQRPPVETPSEPSQFGWRDQTTEESQPHRASESTSPNAVGTGSAVPHRRAPSRRGAPSLQPVAPRQRSRAVRVTVALGLFAVLVIATVLVLVARPGSTHAPAHRAGAPVSSRALARHSATTPTTSVGLTSVLGVGTFASDLAKSATSLAAVRVKSQTKPVRRAHVVRRSKRPAAQPVLKTTPTTSSITAAPAPTSNTMAPTESSSSADEPSSSTPTTSSSSSAGTVVGPAGLGGVQGKQCNPQCTG